MQQSVVQPINSQRGMAAKGRRGDTEFWTRRNSGKFTGYHCTAANKTLSHRHERRVAEKHEIRFWEEDERLAFEADMKNLSHYFEDFDDDYEEDLSYFDVVGSDDAYDARTRTRQLDNYLAYGEPYGAHNEPYYSGCPICGPLGCVLD